MDDYYSHFSEMIAGINREEKAWLEEELEPLDDRPTPKDEKKEAEFVKKFAEERGIDVDTADMWPSFESRIDILEEDGRWWLYAEEHFNSDCLIAVMQRFLRRFRPDFVFSMTWADACPKMKIGAFGGGWLVITANDFVLNTTGYACDAARKKMEKKLARKKKPRSTR